MSEILEQLYYAEPIEAKYIRQGIEKLLDVFFYELERLKINQYILTADELGISQLEKEFEILPDLSAEDLEFRRKRLLNRNITKPPFTLDYMQERLDSLCGTGKYETILDYDQYQLKVRLELTIQNMRNEVDITLKRMVPANMTLIVELRYRQYKELVGYTHRQLKFYTHKEIRELVPICKVTYRELRYRYKNGQLSTYENRQISRREIANLPTASHAELDNYLHQELSAYTNGKMPDKGVRK